MIDEIYKYVKKINTSFNIEKKDNKVIMESKYHDDIEIVATVVSNEKVNLTANNDSKKYSYCEFDRNYIGFTTSFKNTLKKLLNEKESLGIRALKRKEVAKKSRNERLDKIKELNETYDIDINFYTDEFSIETYININGAFYDVNIYDEEIILGYKLSNGEKSATRSPLFIGIPFIKQLETYNLLK